MTGKIGRKEYKRKEGKIKERNRERIRETGRKYEGIKKGRKGGGRRKGNRE